MTKVVLKDPAVVAALDAIANRSEICDSTGRVLGYYVPRSVDQLIYYKGVKSPYSKEELDRRIREETKNSKTLAEFWEDMRKKHPEKFQ
jgi:hypothetical protein